MSATDEQQVEAKRFVDEVLSNALVAACDELRPLFTQIGMLSDEVHSVDVARSICTAFGIVCEIIRTGRREFDLKFPRPKSWLDDYKDPFEMRYEFADEINIVASAYAIAGGDRPDPDAAPKSMLGETYLQFAVAYRFLQAVSEVQVLVELIEDSEEAYINPSVSKTAKKLLKPARNRKNGNPSKSSS